MYRKLISVIVPLYNEQEVITETYKRLTEVLSNIDEEYELIFVNDGSRDATMEMAAEMQAEDKRLRVINFSRNFGHQAAVSAGLENCRGDAAVIIDADLQDPPDVIPRMIEEWKRGADVAYGKRSKRKGETFFKKLTAKAFYRIMGFMTGNSIPLDTGDFRLVDRVVIDAINNMKEGNRYMRGLVPWIGFKQVPVEFVREERFAGETKYTLAKMIKLATDGIFSFSKKPLQLSSLLGFLCMAGACIWGLGLLITLATRGVASSMQAFFALLLFVEGIQLCCIGVMGEYVGRIFDEARNRPNYIIKEILESKEDENNAR